MPETVALLTEMNIIKKLASFGFISVYGTGVNQPDVFTPSSYVVKNVSLNYSKTDPVYLEHGTYISKPGLVDRPFINFDVE